MDTERYFLASLYATLTSEGSYYYYRLVPVFTPQALVYVTRANAGLKVRLAMLTSLHALIVKLRACEPNV